MSRLSEMTLIVLIENNDYGKKVQIIKKKHDICLSFTDFSQCRSASSKTVCFRARETSPEGIWKTQGTVEDWNNNHGDSLWFGLGGVGDISCQFSIIRITLNAFGKTLDQCLFPEILKIIHRPYCDTFHVGTVLRQFLPTIMALFGFFSQIFHV